jgi:hypothetical protein
VALPKDPLVIIQGGDSTIRLLQAQIIVKADARSPYNYRSKPYKAFQELKDISRVCPGKYRGLIAKVPYKASKFQRLSAIAIALQGTVLKSHDFMPRYP